MYKLKLTGITIVSQDNVSTYQSLMLSEY